MQAQQLLTQLSPVENLYGLLRCVFMGLFHKKPPALWGFCPLLTKPWKSIRSKNRVIKSQHKIGCSGCFCYTSLHCCTVQAVNSFFRVASFIQEGWSWKVQPIHWTLWNWSQWTPTYSFVENSSDVLKVFFQFCRVRTVCVHLCKNKTFFYIFLNSAQH